MATDAPHNIDAEESVVGALMLSEVLVDQALATGLATADFFSEKHRAIYAAIVSLHTASKVIDPITVVDKLKRDGRLDDAGGKDYVDSLSANCAAAGNILDYVEIVVKSANQRNWRTLADKIHRAASNGGVGEEMLAEIGMTVEGHRQLTNGVGPAATASGWDETDLDPVLKAFHSGESLTPVPTIMKTDAGRGVFHAGMLTSVAAPPDSGKGWLWSKAAADVMAEGGHVLCLDFEESPKTRTSRFLLMGVAEDVIRERFHYFRPWEPIGDPSRLNRYLEKYPVTLVIIDSVAESMAAEGLNPMDNADAATWINLIPRQFQRYGCAVLTVDHEVKNKENRNRYAIGAQHKLAEVDMGLSLHVSAPLGRGKSGRVAMTWTKDRHGYRGRGHHTDMTVDSTGDEVTVSIKEVRASQQDLRPTERMEAVSRVVESHPGIGKDRIRNEVKGRAAVTDDACRILVEEGHIQLRREGRKTGHHSIGPYRENGGTTPPIIPRDRDGLIGGESA